MFEWRILLQIKCVPRYINPYNLQDFDTNKIDNTRLNTGNKALLSSIDPNTLEYPVDITSFPNYVDETATFLDITLHSQTGEGQGAKANITTSSTKITSITVTDPGNNYINGDVLFAVSYTHLTLPTKA